MTEIQNYINVNKDNLLSAVSEREKAGFRLAAISAVTSDSGYEILYSLARDNNLEHLRIEIVRGEDLPSVEQHYPCAFLYESEIEDLFGITVLGRKDTGRLYKIAEASPFGYKGDKENG
jgi:ech hydrogenase subunit D